MARVDLPPIQPYCPPRRFLGPTVLHKQHRRWQLQQWYESNPENQGEPILTYPIDIVIQNQDLVQLYLLMLTRIIIRF